jgi:integrase
MVGSGMPKSYREQRICKTWFCGNPPALLFATRRGGPLSQRNVIRAFYIAGAKCEFHALRRLRTGTLRRTRVPEDLIRLWLGHAGSSMTYTYAKGTRDRRQLATGMGQSASHLGYKGLQILFSFKAAK